MEYKLLLSVIPPLSAIILALISRQVIPSLLAGLWIGCFIAAPGILESVSKTTEYVTGTISQRGNLDVLLFLYAFSGLVSMIKLSGGVQGFAKLLSRIIKSKRGAMLGLWALEPITFIDCGFRVVATGAIMKAVIKRNGISKEKFAYMLNNSASPVISIIPIATTFVGYMTGVTASGLKTAGIKASPYLIFLKSIPYNFFSFASIIIAVLSILGILNFRIMKKFDRISVNENNSNQIDKNNKNNMKMNHDNKHIDMDIQPKPWNLIVPVTVLIILSFYLMWWSGKGSGDTIVKIFSNADSSRAMLLALFITTVISAVFYRIQGMYFKDMIEEFIKGGNKLMKTIAILAVAWPIAKVSKDLGLPRLITLTIGTWIPAFLIPVIIFAITGLITFFIGSSWGTWALMMPLALPLAAITGASIPMSAAAVFAGGTFGDVTSPLSGMAAMASGIAGAEHMDYIKAQMPYNITAALLAGLGFLIFPLL